MAKKKLSELMKISLSEFPQLSKTTVDAYNRNKKQNIGLSSTTYNTYQKMIEKQKQEDDLISEYIGDLDILSPMLKYGKANKLVPTTMTLQQLFRETLKSYKAKKARAKNRGIHMPMTYKEYIWWWGADWFHIGLGNGMVMARNGDTGQYKLGNIYKATARQNSSDATQHGRTSNWVNPVLVDYVDGHREKYMSIKLACEALKINRNDFEKLKDGSYLPSNIKRVVVLPKELV